MYATRSETMEAMNNYYYRVKRGPPFKPKEEMKYEAVRLSSFVGWPTSVPKRPMELAVNGFYYDGQGDNVTCFTCNGVVGNWTIADQVDVLHKKLYPECAFVEGTTNNMCVSEWNQVKRSTMVPGVHPIHNAVQGDILVGFTLKSFQDRSRKRKRDKKNKRESFTEESHVRRTVPVTGTHVYVEDNEEVRALVQQYQQMKEERTCKICMDELSTIAFLSCGHLVSCVNCAPALRSCPSCKKRIKRRRTVRFN